MRRLFNVNSEALKQNILAAYHRWGFKLIKEERYSEALKVLDMALVYSPFSYILHYDQAIAYSGAKQYEKSIAEYKVVLDVQPNFSPAKIELVSALNNLGAQQAQNNALNEAIKSYSEALKWDPECKEVRQNLESIYLRLGWEKSLAGKFSEAIEEYQRVLTLNPQNAEAYNDMGVALYKQKQYDDAIVAFGTALTLKPQYSDAYRNLKKCTRRQKMLTEFKSVFEFKSEVIPPNEFSIYIRNNSIEVLENIRILIEFPSEVNKQSLKGYYLDTGVPLPLPIKTSIRRFKRSNEVWQFEGSRGNLINLRENEALKIMGIFKSGILPEAPNIIGIGVSKKGSAAYIKQERNELIAEIITAFAKTVSVIVLLFFLVFTQNLLRKLHTSFGKK